MATFLFLYITVLTVMGYSRANSTVDVQGIACGGGHINPAVTFGLFLARKLSLPRAVFYIMMQCLGALCGAGVVKGFRPSLFEIKGGGANVVSHGYTKGDEIIVTSVLVYALFSDTVVTVPLFQTAIFWLLSQLDLQCSWFIWPPSLSQALALTLLEA